MEEIPNLGTSINNPEPLDPSQTTNLGIFKTLEEQPICKSGAPTPDGGRSSSTEETTLSISKTRRSLMSLVLKMLKPRTLSFTADTTEPTRDGQLFTSTDQRNNQPRE
jgi:hypothetical protein